MFFSYKSKDESKSESDSNEYEEEIKKIENIVRPKLKKDESLQKEEKKEESSEQTENKKKTDISNDYIGNSFSSNKEPIFLGCSGQLSKIEVANQSTSEILGTQFFMETKPEVSSPRHNKEVNTSTEQKNEIIKLIEMDNNVK
ncbi:MAG: hypothetical protein MJ252_13480 [archaeon]|nr:hypothetical protein [archaeon]